jgi:uncharacterized protein YcbX
MPATLGAVTAIWRYPVKSMRGQRLDAVSVTVRGLAGDRAFALIDPASGKVASAKHPRLWGRLPTCAAALLPSVHSSDTCSLLHITFPDDRTVPAGAAAERLLSDLLGREIVLSAEPPAAAEIDRYWPDIEGLFLRDTITSGAIGAGAPPNTFFDHAPVHLITTASLAHLQTLYPPGCVDVRRFRPNLVIATPPGTEGFTENDWVGRTLLIGNEVRLRITDPTPRCVITTLAQADLPQDIGILRTVAAHNRPPIPALGDATQPCLGVYGVVEQGGMVRLHDQVQPA